MACINQSWDSRRSLGDYKATSSVGNPVKPRPKVSEHAEMSPVASMLKTSPFLDLIMYHSATARQLQRRFNQIRRIPQEWALTRQKKEDTRSLKDVSIDYIRYVNLLLTI